MAKQLIAAQNRGYWSVPMLATYLGLAKGTIYRAVQAGDLKSVRFGDRILISNAEVERLEREGLSTPEAVR